MRHGIFSEAITRFTKGQPAALTAPVLAEAVELLNLSAGGVRASDVADAYPGKKDAEMVYAKAEHMNAALGSDFTTETIVTTLENVGFAVEVSDDDVIKVRPPYWRADIHISEDLDEEVGRLNGFDNIKKTLPKRDFTAVSPSYFDQTRAKIRQTLARAGANEVLSYNFVHGDLLKKAGQKPEDSFRIVNSLSPDLQYYRQSVLPSLLQLVHPNIKAGFNDFALFELNKAHTKVMGMDENGLPYEQDHLALLITHKEQTKGSAYYDAKKYLDYLAESFGLQFYYKPIEEHPGTPNAAPFEHRRSAKVFDASTGEQIGIVGELKSSVVKNFKLPKSTAAFVIDSAEFAKVTQGAGTGYKPLSRYPGTERDICFQVENSVRYRDIAGSTQDALADTNFETAITPIDIYQAEGSEKKNITIRISFTSYDKTLTGDEITELINKVTEKVATDTRATVV
jgi:phenylalanyl-tRNA synthetase beta chain